MTLFRYLAYLTPAAAGFGVAAALALTRGRPVRRRLVAGLSVLGVLLVLLGVGIFTESIGAFMAVTLLVAGFAVLVAGFFLFGEALGLPPEACQVASGLLVAGLLGSVFLFGAVLEDAVQEGMSGDEIGRRIQRALDVNPVMVIGYSVFHKDLLVSKSLYRLELADYHFKHLTPHWKASAAGYALAGFTFFAGSILVSALRRGLRSVFPGGREARGAGGGIP